jgi:hypothetical protein
MINNWRITMRNWLRNCPPFDRRRWARTNPAIDEAYRQWRAKRWL